MKEQYWTGSEPSSCQICGRSLNFYFIDGKVKEESWAYMCCACHKEVGVGLGIGRGQAYQKQPSGRWLKVGG